MPSETIFMNTRHQGLPIEDSFAMSVSIIDCFTDCTGKLTPAAFHSFRIIFIYQIPCFYNHHIATEFLTDMLDILNTVRYYLVFVCPESILGLYRYPTYRRYRRESFAAAFSRDSVGSIMLKSFQKSRSQLQGADSSK